MKKVISISAEDSVINEFTTLAHEFWTNRTNLISMFMVDFIENKKVFFQKTNPIDSIEFDSFTDEQNESLMIKWKDSYDSISNSLKWI